MKRLFPGVLTLVFLVSGLSADPFRFQFHPGDQYRFYGASTQHITVDGRFLQDSLQTYKIAFSVSDADPDGSGRLQGHITYLTQPKGEAAGLIDQEYDTDYRVDARGQYTVPPEQVMPVVRNVPVFPEGELKVGDRWTGKGEEVHDMKADFGVDQVLRVPLDVYYWYTGSVVKDGVTLQVIRSDYKLDKPTGFNYPDLKFYPLKMTGYFHQKIYFNAEKGREEGYEEDYRLILEMNTGQVVEYSGHGSSGMVEAKTMDKPALVAQVKKDLEDRGLPDVQVQATSQGVSLNLDQIHFPGDSALLVASEQEKLQVIAEVLKAHPDRDILVEGHTADVVGGADPQTLSEARAAAVGNYLVSLGVRQPNQIVYRGWGASKPLVPNDTEENRAKNRRVEITLLEN